MTNQTTFIAGDWGTSNLRLYLCEYRANGQSQILETRYGPGVSQLNGDFEEKIFSLIQPWLAHHPNAPVLLSGMIGSTIGWKEAPYLTCPASVEQIANGRLSFTARGTSFSILAGLRTINPLGNPDVMRGEELQMLGWLNSQTTPPSEQLFALPGTHNKWTMIRGQQVENFLTAFTGELFALLKNNSILVTNHDELSFNHESFMLGVSTAERLGSASLLHGLFSTRAKQVLGDMPSADAQAYLSGMIIATDVIGARSLWPDSSSVVVIAEQALSERYASVLEHFDLNAQCGDPASIAVQGYAAIYQQLFA
ncbi:2-dehydro-3-deoxygalactonokinase [Arenicella xantha]|uniref:2-keto-3-deoxygalactonate kinase n=1 Tax=Arenicella xantha TaxID=644221 RepID=A0A395JLN4_9GAMM|nr:2-dehydro-3-deoxygalactonokinase [Arenicella xantha]RBP51621.1 2-keto-3-deoxygalactonate kinase [Arenicella xantha]